MTTTIPPSASIEIIKPIAYDYTRFSTKEQSAGDSERRQKDKAQQWADANGYQLKHLHDPGISAFHGKNRVLGQLNLFIRSIRLRSLGTSPVLLIENFDRMSREVIEEAQSLFLELINGGAVIVTLHNGKQYARGMGLVDIISALVEMDVAHQHSAKLSSRVREAIIARRRAGGIIHNRASSPRWLSLDAKRTIFRPIPERVALVNEMFARAARGDGADTIARVFNARNEPVWSGAEHWRGTAIRDILKNRAVLGEFAGNRGYFGDAVITTEQWAAVNHRTSRAAQSRGAGVVRELNLFTGIIASGLDGSAMILRSSGMKSRTTGRYVWHYYLVSNATLAGKSVHPHRVHYRVIENRILWLLANVEPGLLAKMRCDVACDLQAQIASGIAQVDGVKKQVAKLTRLVLADDDPSPALVVELKSHEAQLEIRQAGLDALRLSASRAVEVPNVPALDDLVRPEIRRALRKEIALWCMGIEVFGDHLICWFNDNRGIRVNLEGIPIARDHCAGSRFSMASPTTERLAS